MNTEKKMNGLSAFMDKSLAYLAYEFGCGIRCVKRSDIIPICEEQVFSPSRKGFAKKKWAHSSAKVSYGLNCYGSPFANVIINGVSHPVAVTSPRKTAKSILGIIEVHEV
jgi:hypothetical protein